MEEHKVTVLIKLTSFNCQDLAKKYPENYYQRVRHLPIAPSAAHPDNDILLLIQGDLELRKKTYVKTDARIILKIAVLIPYCRSGKEYKLTQESYYELTAYINIIAPTTDCCVAPTPPLSLPTTSTTHPYQPTPPQSILQTVERTPLRTQSIPPRRPTVPTTFFYPQLYRNTQRDRLSDTAPYNPRPPPSVPDPGPRSLAQYIFLLLVLGSLGAATYGGYRLFNLGKWMLKEIKRTWGQFNTIPALMAMQHFSGAITKRLARYGMFLLSRLEAKMEGVKLEDLKALFNPTVVFEKLWKGFQAGVGVNPHVVSQRLLKAFDVGVSWLCGRT